MVARNILGGALWLAILFAWPVLTQAAVTGIHCQAAASGDKIACSVRKGPAQHATFTVIGKLKMFAGRSVQMVVARQAGTRYHFVLRKKFAVASSGSFTFEIPISAYPDGSYGFILSAANATEKLLAQGRFILKKSR